MTDRIDHTIDADQPVPADDVLAKVRSLCKKLPISDLLVGIEVHRTNCQQPSCPVLAAMEDHARARKVSA